jgi:Spy/CpxP family protein refolding chaperone
MQKLHQDSSLSQQDRMSKMREIHQNTTSQIRETLTPDQQQKLDAMKANREEHHHSKKSGQAQPQ